MSEKENLHKKYLEHDLCNGIPYDVYQYVYFIENENNKLLNEKSELIILIKKIPYFSLSDAELKIIKKYDGE